MYKYLWLCGLGGAGKTVAMRHVRSMRPDLTCLSDSVEILKLLETSEAEADFTRHSDGSFTVNSSRVFHCSIEVLVEKCRQSNSAVIELSRGLDLEGKIDLSFLAFLQRLPEEILTHSLLVYVSSKRDERIARNELRPNVSSVSSEEFPSFKCPTAAMSRFFSEDDFWKVIPESAIDFVVINNRAGRESFLNRIASVLRLID